MFTESMFEPCFRSVSAKIALFIGASIPSFMLILRIVGGSGALFPYFAYIFDQEKRAIWFPTLNFSCEMNCENILFINLDRTFRKQF